MAKLKFRQLRLRREDSLGKTQEGRFRRKDIRRKT